MSFSDYTKSKRSSLYSNFDYQPNFILVGSSFKKNSNSAFGDIIPIYKNATPLADTIVSSWDSLTRVILLSKVFFVCIISLITEIINNAFYQSFIFIASIYNQVVALPDKYIRLKVQVQEIFKIFSSSQARGLWWLGIKLEIKELASSLYDKLSLIFLVLNKFYLFILISITFVSLAFSGSIGSSQKSSYLATAVDNYSVKDTTFASQIDTTKLTPISLIKQENENKDNFLMLRVVEHKVRPSDTLESVAEMYGLRTDTVAFNNQIGADNKLPETLYLPYTDSYIYKTTANTTIDDLVRIYGIEKTQLYSQNEAIYNHETNSFPANSYVIIPTTDFTSIANHNQAENERIANLAKAEEQKRASLVALTNADKQTYANSHSDAKSLGFIWPTNGYISRCVQPGHIACDIANNSQPPIFAAKSGTVSMVSRFQVAGYGLMVKINHGNGEETLYAHMSEIYVEPGQQLVQGQAIGRMGATGWATGIHLHFEIIINGSKQDPLRYLP